jgi:signal transduction histidine kinase
VQDDGPGIPPALFNKALEMFQTLKPRDKVEGSGMGLSLVQKVVLHYEGQLTIESDGQRGTKVIIKLPIKVKI